MAFFEFFAEATEPRHWRGDMQADRYYYSAGVAGQRFLEALRDEGRLLGAYCPACDWTYVPPRLYCERCFAELADLRDVGRRGHVRTFTVARIDNHGNPLEPPEVLALIAFGPRTTALLHRLGDVAPEEVRVGMEVEAALKPKPRREAKITDILCFRPARPRR